MNTFSNTLRVSGYSETERYNLIKGAHLRFLEMKELVRTGAIPSLNRNRKQIIQSKIDKKNWPNTWFLRGSTVGTVSCQVTPNSNLKKSLSKRINTNREGGTLQVIEDGGIPITAGIKVTFQRPGCVFGDPQCIVTNNTQCDQSGLIYNIKCSACYMTLLTEGLDNGRNNCDIEYDTPTYTGLTRNSIHARMVKHLELRNTGATSSPLHRHDRDHHKGVKQVYVADVVAKERKILRLYTLEALLIEKSNPTSSMNDRMEGGRGGIVRIRATRVT